MIRVMVLGVMGSGVALAVVGCLDLVAGTLAYLAGGSIGGICGATINGWTDL